MTTFHHEANAKFGIDRMVTARVGDLFVEEMAVSFEIREVDGQETIWDVSKRRNIVLTVPAAEAAVVPLPVSTPEHNYLAVMPATEARDVLAGTGGKIVRSSTFLPLTTVGPWNSPASAKTASGRS